MPRIIFRRRQTQPRRTLPVQQTLTSTKTVDPKVINFSSRILNQTEIMLLSKGLKISPTPFNSNNQELTKDINDYTRKLRLAEYFYSEDTEKEEDFIFYFIILFYPDLVRNKSTFNQKRGRNDVLNTVCDTLENIPLENNGKKKAKK